MDRGVWQVRVHRVAKSQTGLKRLSTHACCVGFHHATTGNSHNFIYISHNYIYIYIYIYPLPVQTPSPLPPLARFHVLYSSFLIAIYFIYESVYKSMLFSQFVLPSPSATGSNSVSYICIFVTSLQIGSSVVFF